VYRGDLTIDQRVEIHSRRVDGSGVTIKLNVTPVAFGNVGGSFSVNPDSGRVVWIGDLDVAFRTELYSRSIDGSGPQVKINDAPVAFGQVVASDAFRISPNGQRIVYVGNLMTESRFELYSRAIDGSGPQVTLNALPVPGGSVTPSGLQITPDGSRVLFMGDLTRDGVQQLYSRPIDGSGSQVQLNQSAAAGVAVPDFAVTPDSKLAVFRSDYDRIGEFELYARPVDGNGVQTKLNNFLPTGSDVVAGYKIAPDSSGVYFQTTQADVSLPAYELYFSSFSGGPARLLYSTSQPLLSWDLAPNGQFLILQGELETTGVIEVFRLNVPEPASLALGEAALAWCGLKLRLVRA
jgi:Tol biopolymer transport system component